MSPSPLYVVVLLLPLAALLLMLSSLPNIVHQQQTASQTSSPSSSSPPSPPLSPYELTVSLPPLPTLSPPSSSIVYYGVVIDCGSTGTRLHIYTFNSIAPLLLDEEIFEEIKPGLSSYAGRKGGGDAIYHLLTLSASYVPANYHAKTHVRVYATAGLRLLEEKYQRQLLDDVDDAMRHFDFVAHPAEIMNGLDEGVYAWLTVNFLLNQLNDNSSSSSDTSSQAQVVASSASSSSSSSHAPSGTSTILDMGGASTQIVFQVSSSHVHDLHDAARDRLQRFVWDNREYALYAHSYLGYGLMEVRNKIKNNIVEYERNLHVNSSLLYQHYHHHINTTLHAANLAIHKQKHHLNQNNNEYNNNNNNNNNVYYHPCLSDVYDERLDSGVELRGITSSFSTCLSLIKQLFPKHIPCTLAPCSFSGIFALPLPKTSLSLYAFSYYYDRLEIFDVPPIVSVAQIKNYAEEICRFSIRLEREMSELEVIKQLRQTEQDMIYELLTSTSTSTSTSVSQSQPQCRVVTYQLLDGTSQKHHADGTVTSVLATSHDGNDNNNNNHDADEDACIVVQQEAQREPVISSPVVGLLHSNPHLCLDLTYLYGLLHFGYDLPDDYQLYVKKKINNKETAWCLGAMLQQISINQQQDKQ